jgi:asparagine synthase (glutamine-hydrolysing)
MCGIVGFVALDGRHRADRVVVSRMLRAIHHRGPDDEGMHLDERATLAMRRLSIIDVHGGHQPIGNRDGSLWVVCNGEIYNFRELRSTLMKEGSRFRSGSDCEVLIHLYAKHGEAFVEHLNGMFAFALWDARERKMIVGRDRLGIKPLYYVRQPGSIVFASEVKALLTMPGFSVRLDQSALEAYLSLGYVPAPLTLVDGVRKLPPASLLVVKDGGVTIRRYWEMPNAVDHRRSEDDWSEAIREQLDRAVHSQMVSDVPIGAFLSGGIDSSAVVALMAKHSAQPVKTYSIGFEGGGAESLYNELPYAREVAHRFGTDHREIMVTPDVVGLLPRLIWHLDEPLADSALVTTYLVAEFARRDVKVILSGVGGDELFGGYRRYLGEHYGRMYRRLPRWLRETGIPWVAEKLPSDRHSRILNASRLFRSFVLADGLPLEEGYRRYVEVFSPDLLNDLLVDGAAGNSQDALAAAFRETTAMDPLLRLLTVDSQTQLPDDLLLLTDKMTMATSLECRVPFLDHELVELGARVPTTCRIKRGNLKYILKKALAGLLPDSILKRPKRGFGAPIGAWMKQQLAPTMNTLLSESSVRKRGLFRWDAVRRTIDAHYTNRADHTDHLAALMNLEIWCRIFLDGDSHEDVTDAIVKGEEVGDSLRLPSLSLSP